MWDGMGQAMGGVRGEERGGGGALEVWEGRCQQEGSGCV